LPYQPRPTVPWRGLDMLLVFSVYVMTMVAVQLFLMAVVGDSDLGKPPAIQSVDKSSTEHVVARLLAEGSAGVLLVCCLSVVVVAPIAEEFFFRVLLQGWLEAGYRRLRHAMPTLRRLMPGAVGPIVLTSFLFALVHFRVDAPTMNMTYLTLLVAANATASLLAVALVICLLRIRAGASAADLGWVREKFSADVRLGLAAFAAVAAPIYAAQISLAWLLPKYLAPDPFVMFPFALVLGTLYWRTHRIVPSIVLHVSLNATSLAMAIVLLFFQK